MKHAKLILLVALAAVLGSCAKEPSSSKTDTVSDGGGYKSVTVTTAATKTFIGDEESGSVSVYWSAGDRINVNGVMSSALAVAEGEKLTSASFDVNNVEAPYKVIYPNSALKEDQEGTLSIITISSSQQYTAGSFAVGADILYGYSAEEGVVALEHLCSTIKLNLKTEEEVVVKSLTVTALAGEPICGDFLLDVKEGTITKEEQEGEDVSSQIQIVIPEEGLTLGTTPTPIYFTIPGGDYAEGFEFTFTDVEGLTSTLRWLRWDKEDDLGLIVTPGRMVDFGEIEYVPGVRIINSAEDWAAFVAACNSGVEGWDKHWVGKDGCVTIGSDFEVEKLDRIANLKVVLDGCGHTITQTSATQSLAAILSPGGAIRNLTLAGAMTSPVDPSDKGAVVFVTTMKGGEISNCVNATRIVYTATSGTKKFLSAGFVRSMMGGKIVDCVNNGEITVTVNLTDTAPIAAGGFVATVRDLTERAVIRNCVNKAPVTVLLNKDAGLTKSPTNFGVGGIVGNCVSGDAINYLTIKNCSNTAAISVKHIVDPTSSSASATGVAGIVGLASVLSSNGVYSIKGVKVVLDGCSNSGTVTTDMVSNIDSRFVNKNFGAGIAGIAYGPSDDVRAVINDCHNTGDVVAYAGKYSRAALSTVYGGLVGLSGYANITGCSVKCSVGGVQKQMFAISAGVGLLMYKSTISDCRFFANLNVICSTTYNAANYSLVATSPMFTSSSAISIKKGSDGLEEDVAIAGSEIKDCKIGGTLTTNPTLVTYSANGPFTVATTTYTEETIASAVLSSTYELGGVNISNITYWDGN